MNLYRYEEEFIGTLNLTRRGWVAKDADGRLIARSWRLRRLGRAVEAHVEAKAALLDLPF